MVIAPPLVITRKEIDTLVELARRSLDQTYADVKTEVG
jgi:putrescine aminotransferase